MSKYLSDLERKQNEHKIIEQYKIDEKLEKLEADVDIGVELQDEEDWETL